MGGAGRRPATLLLGMQERAQALGDAARSQPWERVLCHGGLIGDNLPGDRGGWLSVDVRDGPLAPTSPVRGTGVVPAERRDP
jgi:hypothetical protein